MAFEVRPVEYFCASVHDDLEATYRVLRNARRAGRGPSRLHGGPRRPALAQFTLFPADPRKLRAEARSADLVLDGPYHALLVEGDDELGALADVHERLLRAGVDIYASSGVTDTRGSFGYVIHVREDQFTQGVAALSQ